MSTKDQTTTIKNTTRTMTLIEKTNLPWRHIKQTTLITIEQNPIKTISSEYTS
jgi:hypothetical protein